MTTTVLDDSYGGMLIRERPAGTAMLRPDLRQPILWGMVVVLGFVGGFGIWAAVSPLSSAAVAPGSVVVDTQRKTVQHLEGGIVRDILVREGEQVAVGQPLVRLDTTRAETTWQEQRGQLIAARAQEGRLIAERDGVDAIRFPAALETEALSDETVRVVLQGQRTIFEARSVALEGQRQILSERVSQLRSQIAGLQAQERATLDQNHLIQDELVDVRGLVDKGLERRPRLRALERQAAELVGRLGEYRGNIARTEQVIGETRLQIIDLDNRRAEEVVADLRETQTRIADLQERVRAAEDVLRRRDILAPVNGSIVNLKMVTPGGVVTPGAALLEIVPEDDTLTVQARIRPTDIDSVHPGLAAKVRLTAFQARTTPMLDGKLVYVSADTLIDPRTGMPYYDARIKVDRYELDRLEHVHLYPGMPVQVMVVTGERTLLEYLVQPLHDSITRAFRED